LALAGVNRRAFLPAEKSAERSQARGLAFVSARVAQFRLLQSTLRQRAHHPCLRPEGGNCLLRAPR
jgi:hypothetical protein